MVTRLIALVVLVSLLGGCASAGFDPRHDAMAVSAQVNTPDKAGLKQDPGASQWLTTNPRTVAGYDIVSIAVSPIPMELKEELRDFRRMYRRAEFEGIRETEKGFVIDMRCRSSQKECVGIDDVKTDRVPLIRRVFRAAVYGDDGKPAHLYDALWRPNTGMFLILFPNEGAKQLVGKPIYILGANGNFLIGLDGALYPHPKDTLQLPVNLVGESSRLRGTQVLRVRRDNDAGAYLLGTLAQEFFLPAPFHDGVTHVEYYLGIAKLTPENSGIDCYIGHGGGNIFLGLSPLPGQLIGGFLLSVVTSLPGVNRCIDGASQLEPRTTSVPELGLSIVPDPAPH